MESKETGHQQTDKPTIVEASTSNQGVNLGGETDTPTEELKGTSNQGHQRKSLLPSPTTLACRGVSSDYRTPVLLSTTASTSRQPSSSIHPRPITTRLLDDASCLTVIQQVGQSSITTKSLTLGRYLPPTTTSPLTTTLTTGTLTPPPQQRPQRSPRQGRTSRAPPTPPAVDTLNDVFHKSPASSKSSTGVTVISVDGKRSGDDHMVTLPAKIHDTNHGRQQLTEGEDRSDSRFLLHPFRICGWCPRFGHLDYFNSIRIQLLCIIIYLLFGMMMIKVFCLPSPLDQLMRRREGEFFSLHLDTSEVRLVDQIWKETLKFNVLNETSWKSSVIKVIHQSNHHILSELQSLSHKLPIINPNDERSSLSMSSSFLFAFSLLTLNSIDNDCLPHGLHVARQHTYFFQILLILYTALGVPMFALFLYKTAKRLSRLIIHRGLDNKIHLLISIMLIYILLIGFFVFSLAGSEEAILDIFLSLSTVGPLSCYPNRESIMSSEITNRQGNNNDSNYALVTNDKSNLLPSSFEAFHHHRQPNHHSSLLLSFPSRSETMTIVTTFSLVVLRIIYISVGYLFLSTAAMLIMAKRRHVMVEKSGQLESG